MTKIKTITIVLLAIGVALIICGIYFSQHQEVLAKARLICLECIGIG